MSTTNTTKARKTSAYKPFGYDLLTIWLAVALAALLVTWIGLTVMGREGSDTLLMWTHFVFVVNALNSTLR